MIDPAYREVTWLVSNPKRFYKLNNGMKIYIAQTFDTPVYEEPGMIWVNSVMLLREATHLDLKPFGIHKALKQIVY